MATIKRSTRPIRKKVVPKKPLPTKKEIVVKYIQFSKRITAFVLIFWAVYRSAQLAVGVIEPSIADALVKLSSGIDTVAIAFGIAYTGNSVCEKFANVHKEVQKYMYSTTDSVESSVTKGESEDEIEKEEESDNG